MSRIKKTRVQPFFRNTLQPGQPDPNLTPIRPRALEKIQKPSQQSAISKAWINTQKLSPTIAQKKINYLGLKGHKTMVIAPFMRDTDSVTSSNRNSSYPLRLGTSNYSEENFLEVVASAYGAPMSRKQKVLLWLHGKYLAYQKRRITIKISYSVSYTHLTLPTIYSV